jgi:anti-sigma regulatory factor (Ser/Thr protein kinase)
MISAGFHRSFDALSELFEFTRRFYDEEGIADDVRLALDFCVEEIFTNLVKYNGDNPNDIELELERRGRCLVARLTDFDVEPFDVTQSPPIDTALPLERREPGGLGLHLVRRLADDLAYDYTNRRSQITVTKNLG